MSHSYHLSKSSYLLALQCKKALWLSKHRKDIELVQDKSIQARFDTGNEVGSLAHQLYPQGKLIERAYEDIKKTADLTKELFNSGESVIFEAAAVFENTFCFIDILEKIDKTHGEASYNLIEVKSSTDVKDYHVDDMSFQYYVFSSAGYKIENCYLMHIDNSYVRNGDIDPSKLFYLENITDKVLLRQNLVEEIIPSLNNVLNLPSEPSVEIGHYCSEPFECRYLSHCWKDVPEYSLFNIFSKEKSFEMSKDINSYEIQNIPTHLYPSGVKKIDIEAYKKNEVHADKEELSNWLSNLEMPLYYLDYETIMHAIPLFDNTSPYQQIPFQFSLHIQQDFDSDIEHLEFLHKEQSDPREAFICSLIELCEKAGSIIVYNKAFEATRNKELARDFPKYAQEILAINERMVDLMIPFRKRWLYSPKQKSSASIKSVLPAFTDLTYDALEVANGQDAMDAYTAFQCSRIELVNFDNLWNNLLKYCELDTFAMVKLLKEIIKKIE